MAVLVLSALVAASCGGDADEPERSDALQPSAGVTADGVAADGVATDGGSAGSVTTTTRGPLGSGEPVTIAFGGDASFEGLDGALASDPASLLSAIGPVLGAADISIVNLEAALATGGDRAAKTFTFRVPRAALDALDAAGTDVVTMANNHGMDYGATGLSESLTIRQESEVAVIGIGADAEDAYRPFVTEVRGQRIGFLAANDVFDSNLVSAWTATEGQPGIASVEEAHQDAFAAAVRALRPQVDTLAVYLHYGTETETCPNGRQRELVELLTAAGADIVVGSHAHRLQGMGYLGDRFVAYGLSNFVFRSPSDAGRATGVLTITATGSRVDGYDWAPAYIQGNVPVPLTGSARDQARAAMAALQPCTGLSAAPGSN